MPGIPRPPTQGPAPNVLLRPGAGVRGLAYSSDSHPGVRSWGCGVQGLGLPCRTPKTSSATDGELSGRQQVEE